uniref:Putative tick til 10 n=1 Tax=Amblyomma triste TaxID=251400 RepID=A0A023GCU9_AMBTT
MSHSKVTKLASLCLLALLFVLCSLLLHVRAEPSTADAVLLHGEQRGINWRPPKNVCPPHEIYLRCTNSICCEWKCGTRGRRYSCNRKWKSGCFCAAGYNRNQRNKCIKERRCNRPWNPAVDYEPLTPKRRLGYAGF